MRRRNARAVRLDSPAAIVAEVARPFNEQKDNKEWLVEFPPQALSTVSADAAMATLPDKSWGCAWRSTA